MDIEQLKLVLEMVGTATEGAMWFAFAWLAKGFITSLIGWVLGGYVLYYLARFATEALNRVSAMYAMRDADPRTSRCTGILIGSEIRDIVNTHRRGCEAIMAERNAK